MPKNPPNPLIEPVFVTDVGFDLFGPDHVLVTMHYAPDMQDLKAPKEMARFIIQADQLAALGAKFAEAGALSAQMKDPPGSA
jgi:hypothetical protein